MLGSIVGRIDRLKDELVTCEDYAAWASTLGEADGARAAREREFGELFRAHDRMLARGRARSTSATSCCARSGCCARSRTCARGWPGATGTCSSTTCRTRASPRACCCGCSSPTTARSPPRATTTSRSTASAAPSTKAFADFEAEWPAARVVRLEESFRAGERIVRAAAAVAEPVAGADRQAAAPRGRRARARSRSGRCASERAQAQAVAAEVERLVAREDVAPEDVCVLVRSVRSEGQAVAVAFEERAVPYRLAGAAAFFQRAEVRDLLAWLRLLVDPGDAGAVVRALARPPVELRAIDLARVTQIARRRKLDMVAALAAALESPQIPPEARDRIQTSSASTARRGRDRLHAARTSTCTG